MTKSYCSAGISFGEGSLKYSFPNGHPLNSSRIAKFSQELREFLQQNDRAKLVEPVAADEGDLLLFHTKEYVDFVKQRSKIGTGFLDYGDTPAFPGVYEASLVTVGCTVTGLASILEGSCEHFFNPIGGLHHARRDRAGGFCVFNDAAIAIAKALKDFGIARVAYVDIDAHHGDGVFYGFEENPSVFIGDIHEDGRFLYPGTGFAHEIGRGKAKGTKLNLPLEPGSGDGPFFEAFDRIADFVRNSEPEFIFLQCGADGLRGDPITHLEYSAAVHSYAVKKLHKLSHELCKGRLLAMGGGGYNPDNVAAAWMAIARGLVSSNEV